MTSLESLTRRLDTIEELQTVIKTMKGMAAANLRRDELAVEALRRFAATIDLGWRVHFRLHPDAVPESHPADGALGVVVFGSDHGLCGPVNRHVVARAVALLEGEAGGSAPPVVAAVGTRLEHEFAAAHRQPNETFGMPSTPEGAPSRVAALLVHLDEWRGRGVERVVLVYPRRTPGPSSYEPTAVQVLPVDSGRLRRLAQQPWPTHVLPTTFVPGRLLVPALSRQSLLADLHRAFLETRASVSVSRLAAMQGAQQRIDAKAEELQRSFHRRRQEIITEELLDVFAGFDTLAAPRR